MYLQRLLTAAIVSFALALAGCVNPSATEKEKKDGEAADGAQLVGSASGGGAAAPAAETPAPEEPPVVVREDLPPPVLPPQQCTTDTFRQRAENELLLKNDILFVMDNSGSMRDDWQRVANNMKELVKEIPEGVHVRFGILLGHVAEFEGELYSAAGEPKVLDNKTMTVDEIGASLEKSFNSAMSLQDPGTGEAAFRSLQKSVTKHLSANRTKGFYRADAGLAIVFMSDESEIGFPYPANIKEMGIPDRCDAFWEDRVKKIFYDDCDISLETAINALRIVKGEYPVTAHAFVNTSKEDLFLRNSAEAECLFDSLGYGYFDIVERLNGVVYSIQADRAVGMGQIGAAVLRSLKQTHDFRLTKFAGDVDPATVVARIDGGDPAAHTFNKGANVVHLDNAGKALSEISISYCDIPKLPPAPVKPAPAPKPAPVPAPKPAPEPVPAPAPAPVPAPAPAPQPPVDCMKDYGKTCDYANTGTWKVVGFDASMTSTTATVIWQTEGVLTVGILQVSLDEATLLDTKENKPLFQYVLDASQHVQTQVVSGLQPNTRYYFRVIDSGHGIPAGLHKKIMEPFFTTKEVGKGTGLGLSISQGIVESHGGTPFVDANSPNTCLVVRLPVHAASQAFGAKKAA